MQLQGVITEVLPERSGVGKNGNQWRSATYVLEYTPEGSQWAQHCVFEVMNERINEYQLQKGDWVQVSLSVDAREWQGKWYNSVKAYACSRAPRENEVPKEAAHSAPTMGATAASEPTMTKEDLPF